MTLFPHAADPEDVYAHVSEEDLYVPLTQMVYVGDGISDMPAFALMNEKNGIAHGVFKEEHVSQWQGYEAMNASRRVENLAPADYSENSELMQSLILSVESICKRIGLRELSQGE